MRVVRVTPLATNFFPLLKYSFSLNNVSFFFLFFLRGKIKQTLVIFGKWRKTNNRENNGRRNLATRDVRNSMIHFLFYCYDRTRKIENDSWILLADFRCSIVCQNEISCTIQVILLLKLYRVVPFKRGRGACQFSPIIDKFVDNQMYDNLTYIYIIVRMDSKRYRGAHSKHPTPY